MSDILIKVFIVAALALLALAFFYWVADKVIDIIFPDDAQREAQARSDVEEMLAEANKQIAARPRLRTLRFWNF